MLSETRFLKSSYVLSIFFHLKFSRMKYVTNPLAMDHLCKQFQSFFFAQILLDFYLFLRLNINSESGNAVQ